MCGRYRRKSDKQRISEAFEVSAGLDERGFGVRERVMGEGNFIDRTWVERGVIIEGSRR